MSLPHVLLGLLGKPASGYELKQSFASGAAHYWAADLAQIYPTLKKMEARGWVTSSEAPSTKGPRRRMYQRTTDGLAELCQWIRSGPALGAQRTAWVAQIEHAHLTADPQVTLDLITAVREHFLPLVDLLQSVADEFADPKTSEELHVLLAVQLGVRTNQGRLDWCDEAERMLAEFGRDS